MPRCTPRGMRKTKPTIDLHVGKRNVGFISSGAFFMRAIGAMPHLSAPAFFAISLMSLALSMVSCPFSFRYPFP